MSKKPRQSGKDAAPSEKGPDPAIGDARRHWDALLEHVRAAMPKAEIVWKTYAGKTGTQCVIRGPDRNIAYLKPGAGSFLVSVALSAGGVANLAQSKLPRELIAEVEASPVYPEGAPARVRVDSERSLEHARTLLSIKIADVGSRRANARRADTRRADNSRV